MACGCTSGAAATFTRAPDKGRGAGIEPAPGHNGRVKIRVLPSGGVFHTERDEPVLAAALRSHINLPHSCRSGHCASCRAQLVSGTVAYPDGPPLGLTAGEAAAGMVLLCRARATSDLVVEARAVHPVTDVEIKSLPCRIETRELLAPDVLRLQGLGLPDLIAAIGRKTLRLSPRHSDILAVLVDHPAGLTSEQLQLEVYAADVHSSTMRAEMTRLRALLGDAVVQSRPYRLVVDTECDWKDVMAHLAAGRVREALQSYRGPLLPQSESPGVVSRRESVQEQLRAAVLASGKPDLMVAWTRSRWGADDVVMWQRQQTALPVSSPLRPVAQAESARLERDLA